MGTSHRALIAAAADVGRYSALVDILDQLFTPSEYPDVIRALTDRYSPEAAPVPDPVPEPGNPDDEPSRWDLGADEDGPVAIDQAEGDVEADKKSDVYRWYVLAMPGTARPDALPDDAEPFAVEQGVVYWRYRA